MESKSSVVCGGQGWADQAVEKESGGRVYKNIEGTIEVLSGTEVTDKTTGEKKMVG